MGYVLEDRGGSTSRRCSSIHGQRFNAMREIMAIYP
jgi:hypothetical protein